MRRFSWLAAWIVGLTLSASVAVAAPLVRSAPVAPTAPVPEAAPVVGPAESQPAVEAPAPVTEPQQADVAAVEAEAWPGPPGQPELSVPVPPAAPDGAHHHVDFDGDGVENIADNCVLVANRDQQAAVVPPGATEDPLAVQWKADHPGTPFRLDSELGEACSGYNGNYRFQYEAMRLADDARKTELFAYLGASGPMFGYDKLALAPPTCSSIYELTKLPSFLLGLPEALLGNLLGNKGKEFDCTGAVAQLIEDAAMAGVWGGKRLYTDANGGRIVNRFFPFFTEMPGFEAFAKLFPQVFPYGNGQMVHGVVARGASVTDGRDTIVLDWRNTIANLNLAGQGILIYDECRALQPGVYHCFAWTDIRKGNQTLLWKEGWMPWDLKNPSLQDYLAWRQANGTAGYK